VPPPPRNSTPPPKLAVLGKPGEPTMLFVNVATIEAPKVAIRAPPPPDPDELAIKVLVSINAVAEPILASTARPPPLRVAVLLL